MQVIILYQKPLLMGLDPASKRLRDSLPLAIKTFKLVDVYGPQVTYVWVARH